MFSNYVKLIDTDRINARVKTIENSQVLEAINLQDFYSNKDICISTTPCHKRWGVVQKGDKAISTKAMSN